jgi:hypothetical protein
MIDVSVLSQHFVKEIARLREELLEVEEARNCAMRTIEYYESLERSARVEPMLRTD